MRYMNWIMALSFRIKCVILFPFALIKHKFVDAFGELSFHLSYYRRGCLMGHMAYESKPNLVGSILTNLKEGSFMVKIF